MTSTSAKSWDYASLADEIEEDTATKRLQSQRLSSLAGGQPRTDSLTIAATASGQASVVSPVAPQIPPIPLSSQDFLPMHSDLIQRPFTAHPSITELARLVPGSTQNYDFRETQIEGLRLQASSDGYKSYSSEGSQEPMPFENFSRPRQPSMKRRKESPSPQTCHFATNPQQEPQACTTPDLSRDRGISVSSSYSTTQIPAHTLRPSMSIPDYQTPDSIHTRQRNLNNSVYRPSRGAGTRDSHYSFHRREPLSRGTGLEGQEIRASFRSALTTNSSFQGTSGTERSSVLTKSSSATSIYGRDEGMSVDDAIGMYETGFTDSGVEDNDGGESKLVNTVMEGDDKKRRSITAEEAIKDSLLLPPPSHVQIRDSTSIFKFGGSGRETPTSQHQEVKSEVHDTYFQSPRNRPGTRAEPEPSDYGDSRDRYGFTKQSHYVPRAQYDIWDGPYKEYSARRKKKWITLMKDNGLSVDNPTCFPPKSARVKRFVRKGLPPEWRGAAWFYYAGGPAMASQHPTLYADLCAKAEGGEVTETSYDDIERDLNRTFPDNIRFKPDPPPGEVHDGSRMDPETPILQSLRRVLQAFSIYNPRIGYCQSLNFIAGMLLLFMDEEKSFWMLNIITQVYLPGTHELSLEGHNVDLGVLLSVIKDAMPSIWNKIGGELDGSPNTPSTLRLPPITLCLTAWFMSCFIGNLPTESTLRVWDSFFFEGSRTLFRIALTIFKLGEAEIKAVSDPMEIFQVVQGIPRRMVDCNSLMETCFFKRARGLGITQEAIEKGRAERRKAYAEERERLAKGMTMAATLPSRKGTIKKSPLFGRKGKRTPIEA